MATDYNPGDVVKTVYGVGVLISSPKPSGSTITDANGYKESFLVRIWRIPGKSISSAATAYLNADAIQGKLSAAPGMHAMRGGAKKKLIMVYSYSPFTDTFLVAPVNEDGSYPSRFSEIAPSEIQPASSAKFYPLLHELVRRGDMTVTATTKLLKDEKVAKVVEKSTQLVQSSAENATSKSKEEVDKLTSQVQDVLPDQENIHQVYNMLKDEELTVLLKKGQERLQQLMSTDVPTATKAALSKAGIEISEDDDASSTFAATISKSRETALSSLDTVLREIDVDKSDLEAIREQLESNFTTMFDSLSEAAQSDRALMSIFDTISGKTSEWQKTTGRLLSTKSGSLFMEGATRLKARAANIFGEGKLDWAGEVGTKLTKAFTEGDAAVARLKSLELGDAVRSRLVAAIEVRSGSHGGLDGIIAGALTTVSQNDAGDQMQTMLGKLQNKATSATKNAHETLISVLSRKSEYQDVALLRIEQVLCDLESHLEMSPDEIAAIARGDGGTAAIFEPIAKRASKEIEKQLDAAEKTVTDPTILTGLKHVRKLVSGELSVSNLMDEVVNILNDDEVVAAGETIVKSGESVLDAIEGVSGNKVVDDAIRIAEKAGITKESLMSQMESLDVNDLLDTAGNAVTDEKARRKLVSSATDTALDFILKILPSMPVPPFDGVREGLVYHVSNLSMEGFKVKKEDIVVEIAGMRATQKPQTPRVSRRKKLTTSDESVPAWMGSTSNGGGASQTGVSRTSSTDSGDNLEIEDIPRDEYGVPIPVKATELLIVDVKRISAILDNAVWSFEQTYMPYLKGSGKANIKMSDGSIRLQFELRKRVKRLPRGQRFDPNAELEWEPVLCLHDRTCAIEQVELVLQGEGRLTWIVNKLAAIFKGPLRDYVVKTIVSALTNKSGWILEKLNQNLAPYWDIILGSTGLKLEDLIEAGHDVITSSTAPEDDDLVELVWREQLPLGMNLLLNDESGQLKVVDFPRGSQARAVCNAADVDPTLFDGSTVVAVNGTKYDMQEELFDALRDPSRPKAIKFRLANPEDAARVKAFVDSSRGGGDQKEEEVEAEKREFRVEEITFTDERELGIEFSQAVDDYGLFVRGFVPGPGGTVLAAEREEKLEVGDMLFKVNDVIVMGANGTGKERALELLQKHGKERPLRLSFTKPYLFRKWLEKSGELANLGGPEELVLEERKTSVGKRIVVKDFAEINGTAEVGGIFIGDHLCFVNGAPIGSGCAMIGDPNPPELSDVYKMLRDESIYPAALTFARPKKEESRWASMGSSPMKNKLSRLDTSETICITAESYDQIGCVLESTRSMEVIVADLFAVAGPVQKSMRSFQDRNGKVHLSVEAVNGQFVPSYASTDLVRNAMNRSWTQNGKVEVQFCDDELKMWVHGLVP